MSRPRLIALLLAFITLAVFLPVGSFSFVNFDDNDYVTDNPFVKSGLTATDIRWAFTAFHAGNWHPLTWLSHMLDCDLFGLNAGGHHLVNALFHATNAALLFLLLWRLTRQLSAAAFIAALFAWHPLHVESVAWISERKDVLSTCFALLALLSYVKYAERSRVPASPSRLPYALSLVFFACSLMAKPMAVTLPCLLLLLDFWPLNRIPGPAFRLRDLRRPLLEKIPFFLLTTASCVITFIVQNRSEAVVSLSTMTLHYRLENAPVAAVNYLFKLFWPVNLNVFYPLPDRIPALSAALSAALLVGISVAAWHWRATKPYLLTGWLWFLGTLVPVIGLVQVGGQAMADRYTYIPSIGFFLALVFLARDFAIRLQTPKIIARGLMVLSCTACILATENQLSFWRNGEVLFRRALAMNPANDIALVNLGVALQAQNRTEEALVAYRQAERLASNRYQIHGNIGNLLSLLGRHEEALQEYGAALALRPQSSLIRDSYGTELIALGRYPEALPQFQEAAQRDPALADPHLQAGKVLFMQGLDAEGIKEFQTALRLDPDNYQTLATVAHYLAASDNPAIRDGRNALPLALKANIVSHQNQPVVFDILGMALAENGDFTNAITCAQNALELATTVQLKHTEQIRVRLELYRQNLPWRESFRATNAPVKN
ncbi:MAG: tetratricopeptide repeat protein [Verrucomicrobiae bacterium]|nr:tetratricopeptide repeat protein [Verrucomicrobiae bacterium]